MAALAEVAATLDPDAIQLSGDEPTELHPAAPRATWKVLHLPLGPLDPSTIADVIERARGDLAAGASRILLDAAGGLGEGQAQ